MQFTITELKQLTNEKVMFYVTYLLATVLGIIALFILISTSNNSDFFFLTTEDMKFYGLFSTGFIMCAFVISSSANYSGWNNVFVILSVLIGITLLITFTMFILNINFLVLNSKSNFIYVLGFLIFLKVGIATIQRIIVLFR